MQKGHLFWQWLMCDIWAAPQQGKLLQFRGINSPSSTHQPRSRSKTLLINFLLPGWSSKASRELPGSAVKPHLQSGISTVLPLIAKLTLDASYWSHSPTSAGGLGREPPQEPSWCNLAWPHAHELWLSRLLSTICSFLPCLSIHGVLSMCGRTWCPSSSGS